MNDSELFWSAGFLDGEGTFGAWDRKPWFYRQMRVSAGQKDRRPLERLQAELGGAIYHKGPTMWNWQVDGKEALRVALKLWKYLSPPKQEQCERAVDRYYAYLEMRKIRCRSKRHVLHFTGTYKNNGRDACVACLKDRRTREREARKAVLV